MKIISEARERLKTCDIQGAHAPAYADGVLSALLSDHPALDRADELLEMVKELHKIYCPGHCTFWPIPTAHTTDCKKVRALIAEIEGKK